jgi:hypothetical protein
LKNAKSLKNRTREHEYFFVCDSHNDLSIPKPKAGSQNLGAREKPRMTVRRLTSKFRILNSKILPANFAL